MNAKKWILTLVGVATIAAMGWLIGYTMSRHNEHILIGSQKADDELVALQHELHFYIADKLKKEKENSVLMEIAVQTPLKDDDGTVRIPYTLTYKDLVAGEPTIASVEALAYLQPQQENHESWKVTKVVTAKETLAYSEADVMKAGSEPAESSEPSKPATAAEQKEKK